MSKKQIFVLLGLALVIGGCRRKHYVAAPGIYPTATVMVNNGPTPTTTTAPTSTQTPGGPVSDADRAAARDLFTEGTVLQQQGKYNEALDRFSRSNAVFSAPTTWLRIAQCKVALGKLVEGGESYRALINTKIPAGSPQPFFDAQGTAQQELAKLDERIPRVKISVGGTAPQGQYTVTIDGVAVNPALLGAYRPIDPGTHKFVAKMNVEGRFNANSMQEQTIEIKEREQKEVTFTLMMRH